MGPRLSLSHSRVEVTPSAERGPAAHAHPRTLGWLGTSAIALGGSNQSLSILFLVVAGQGTAAIPLLALGLLLGWAAAPGWTELVLMWPNRVGGIAASCAEAFRPYSPVLANLVGTCYWWGWVPTCGLTALISALALHAWLLHGIGATVLACGFIVLFCVVNLCGIRWVARLAVPLAAVSAGLALLSGLIPLLAGHVNWHQAGTFSLTAPFHGLFGHLTGAMAGLYMIGFAAPAFEAATCFVGETRDPVRQVPRALFTAGAMASVYFVVLPVIWLGTIGSGGLEGQLTDTLGPTFAPLFGSAARSAAVFFVVFNMFHGTIQPLAGASRTLSQLSEDGLLPRLLARRSVHDVPWVATLLTAGMAILFLLLGEPVWLIAAANFTYLIGIGLPSVAVALLRRNAPKLARPWRAPRGTVALCVGASAVWFLAMVLGFEEAGLPTVVAGLVLAYAGSILYAWRNWRDQVASGVPRVRRSIHIKIAGALMVVMSLDAAGYLTAVDHLHGGDPALTTLLSDIFVAAALLSIAVGLILPGMIAHSARAVSDAALRLAHGTLGELTRAMAALNAGDFDAAHAHAEMVPVPVRSLDELGLMANSFNLMQERVAEIAVGLDGARESILQAAWELERNAARQAAVARLGQRALEPGEIGELLADAVAAVAEVTGADLVAVLECEVDPRSVRLAAAVGVSGGEAPAPGALIPVDGSVLPEALDARHPVLLAPGSAGPLAPFLDRVALSSLLMPLHAGPSIWGVLSVDTFEASVFSADEVDFIHAVGNILTEAIGRARTVAEIRHRALHDPLTGLPNRAMFDDQLSDALDAAAATETVAAVLLLDLDDFKLINDSLGHGTGDEVLRRVSGRLTRMLRPGDTVARFGGDEFVFVCTELAGPEGARVVAGQMLSALERPLVLGDVSYHVSASIGIAVSGGPDRGAEDLIREADAAMYRAKGRGRNRAEIFDEVMRSEALSHLRTANDLAVAIERNELRADFQPVVGLPDGVVRGFEALARWRHPVRGEIPPGEFIPVAEESGTILSIGEFVLRQACEQAAGWPAPSCDAPAPWVAVNISLRQVSHGTLALLVAQVLAETGLDPARLHLEITESVLMHDTETSLACLDALRALGVLLSLDDFGTGYSSLAHVRTFPIEVIKIDRSFVADLHRDGEGPNERDATILKAVFQIARGLHLSVIAEGVETAEQAETLRQLGCHLAQGWRFSPPVRAERVLGLLAAGAMPGGNPVVLGG